MEMMTTSQLSGLLCLLMSTFLTSESGAFEIEKIVTKREAPPYKVIQGDIIVRTGLGSKGMSNSVMTTDPERHWKNRKIPFVTDDKFGKYATEKRDLVNEVIKGLEKDSCVRFVNITGVSTMNFPNYLHVKDGYECSSLVGREGGKQEVNLGGCFSEGYKMAYRHVRHELLHAIGFLHEMNRPDRDSHITIKIDRLYAKYNTIENLKRWDLGDSNHKKLELSKLSTNYDIQSIMHYGPHIGFKSHNEFYNRVGFGNSINMTATDKIALNMLFDCKDVKRDIYEEFLQEETDRTYVEMMQLTINPNDKSQRSSLLYPPTLQVKTSDPAINRLEGSYEKTDQYTDFTPVYKHSDNDHHIFFEAPHWYIGLPTERRVRSKGTDLTLIPLIQWEFQQDDGTWRELKVPKDPLDPYSFPVFTLNITIGTGLTPTDDRVKLETVEKIIDVKRMRSYDLLQELDIMENEESLRSFLVFPLTLTLPGKGEFRKMIGPNKTYNDHPVYNRSQTGDIIFFKDNLWRLCHGCDFRVSGSDIGDIRSISPSLMIPRLIFQEWEGMDSIADEVAQEMIRASETWPFYTPWTLSDVKTAAWLVENGHLNQLKKVVLSSDMDQSPVSGDLSSIRRVAYKIVSYKPDEEILIKLTYTPTFNYQWNVCPMCPMSKWNVCPRGQVWNELWQACINIWID